MRTGLHEIHWIVVSCKQGIYKCYHFYRPCETAKLTASPSAVRISNTLDLFNSVLARLHVLKGLNVIDIANDSATSLIVIPNLCVAETV